MKYLFLGLFLVLTAPVWADDEDTFRKSKGDGFYSDAELQKIVADKVAEKFEDSGAVVNVEVKDAHVIFTGTVVTAAQLYVIRSLMQKTKGVKSFENNLEVK
ncbi:BON domain-containing protein [Terasakiella sp. A23]|uniref:BON domain-containing protein n=1 Tax=Terasakiella sp. FCG-A23 TaxID=3080561 RepID=UPI002953D330|nr:BON domain-containing protein [Terasakiella sp. A23]MDV7340763.1 BON domain-containing protein [Terasakiella sp. A23]